MFERYKAEKEKYRYWGMSRGDMIRLGAMALVFLLCIVLFVAFLPGFLANIPEETEGGRPVMQKVQPAKTPKRYGEDVARERLEQMKKERIEQMRRNGEKNPLEDLGSPIPGVPKPLEEFKEDPAVYEGLHDKAEFLPEKAIIYTLHRLNSMDRDELHRKVREEGIPLQEALAAPDKSRGRFVHVEGNLVTIHNTYLDSNPSGVRQLWEGHIYSFGLSPFRNVYFLIFEKDREFTPYRGRSYHGDHVRLEGVFLNTWVTRYESGAKVEMPIVVGRRLTRVHTPPMFHDFPWAVMMIIGAAIVGLFMFFFFKTRAEIKRSDEFVRSIRKRVADMIQKRQTGEAAEAAGSPKPTDETPEKSAE